MARTQSAESEANAPRVVVLAGPNGAGKTTSAQRILQGVLGVDEFVNADTIAYGLSGFVPQRASIEAGRIMLGRLRELATERQDFGFETTLASRSFAPWIRKLVDSGYAFHLVFLSLPSAESAIERVADRVRRGGHAVPEDTVRRRFRSGIRNFFTLYMPLTATWQVIYNVHSLADRVAQGAGRSIARILRPEIWQQFRQLGG